MVSFEYRRSGAAGQPIGRLGNGGTKKGTWARRRRLCIVALHTSKFDDVVAQAAADSHPDLALTIWNGIVNDLIDQVKPKAYEEAAAYLRFMKKVYAQNRRQEDWRRLLEGLRKKHKAKRRLIGVLDTLSKKKLVD